MFLRRIRYAAVLPLLWGAWTAHGQEFFPLPEMEPEFSEPVKERSRKAWEIGVGGTLINWNRVSITGFQATPENYLYHLKSNHLMGGVNIYVARELNPWFYIDLQGIAGMTKNPLYGEKDEKRWNTLYQGGLGLQLRLSPLFRSRYVEPYLRVGVNYLYKDFESVYRGEFRNDPTGEAHWVADDLWNPEGRSKDRNSFVPLSFGAGVQTWLCNSFGLGLQGEYLMPVQKELPRFAQISARLIWRIGGKSKHAEPEVHYVEVPVDRIVERVVEKVVEKRVEVPQHSDVELCNLLSHVHFDFDRDVITAASEKILDQMAKVIKECTDSRFLIVGCTDAKGSEQYNMNLSARRAKAVYEALRARGVPAEILKWKGLGKRTSLIPATGGNSVREGDRKVLIERITNREYWDALD